MRAALSFLISTPLVLGAVGSASAQDTAAWDDFFIAVGGSDNVNRIGDDSVEARPLRDNATEIIGARFFKRA